MEGLSRFFSVTSPFLDERQRRLLVASMVEVFGRGGQALVAVATGMSRNTAHHHDHLVIASAERSPPRGQLQPLPPLSLGPNRCNVSMFPESGA